MSNSETTAANSEDAREKGVDIDPLMQLAEQPTPAAIDEATALDPGVLADLATRVDGIDTEPPIPAPIPPAAIAAAEDPELKPYLDTIRADAKRAFDEGFDIDVCPHPAGSVEREAWCAELHALNCQADPESCEPLEPGEKLDWQ